MTMRNAVIVSAVRTPLSKNNGALADVGAMELAGTVIREAVSRAKVDPSEIDEVIYSNVQNLEHRTSGRVFGLAAGLPISVPGFQVERGCASSLTGLAIAAQMVMLGSGDCYVVGGVESCSNGPYFLGRNKKNEFLPPKFLTSVFSPPKEYGNLGNGMTAEVVAEQYGITREDCDAFALMSHQRATEAEQAGRFAEHIVPVTIPRKRGEPTVVAADDIYRADSSLESLAKLAPAFKADGVVTAGNSSPITDGASALVVMEEERARALGCEILARFRAFSSVGVEPRVMGMGPVYAIRKLLERNDLTLEDIDLFEINEAFAAQVAACVKELGIPLEKVNVNGGAIALGHPFSASGGILTARIISELRRRGKRLGVISFCVGGGLGNAVLVECD